MKAMMKKMMIATMTCVALCGSAMAAPKQQNMRNNPAPQQQVQKAKPQAQKVQVQQAKPQAQKAQPTKCDVAKSAPKNDRREIRRETKHDNHRHEIAARPEPKKDHGKKPNHTMHSEDWAELAVGFVVGLIGG